eukprot:GHVT01097454.1.p1 GENE.GHVT01097454.1~~GHVT01097454.1.p1  ORF type:complete len:105 (-),score=8.38 GHVT01097454.1:175-489(-)
MLGSQPSRTPAGNFAPVRTRYNLLLPLDLKSVPAQRFQEVRSTKPMKHDVPATAYAAYPVYFALDVELLLLWCSGSGTQGNFIPTLATKDVAVLKEMAETLGKV